MSPLAVPAESAYAFLLLLFRASGLVLTAPLLSTRSAPGPLRLGVAFALSAAAHASAGLPGAPLPGHLWHLGRDAGAEVLLGLLAGLGASFALEAAAMAGQLASGAMGLSYAAVLDPLHGAESTALGAWLRSFATLAALGAGLHREAVRWFARSVHEVPAGAVDSLPALLEGALVQALHATALGVRLGFPFFAAITLGHFVLGLLGRAAPGLQLSNLGFSISILFGGWALWAATPGVVAEAARAATALFSP